jgi:Domain of unknown function (DUF2760)
MARLGTAFRAFWRALRDKAFAEQARQLLESKALPSPSAPAVVAPVAPPRPARSEALNLLALLQREARLVDFLKENIAGYSNDQIGAAVRDVHRDASAVLERVFSLRPVMTEAEGGTVQVPAGADAGRVRLVGNVTGQAPYRGALRHAGWEATKVELPQWSGSDASARVVAPAEVEL